VATGTTVTASLGASVTTRPVTLAGAQAIETTGGIGVVRSVSTTSCVGPRAFVPVALCLGPLAFVTFTTSLGSFALIASAASLGSLAWLVFLGGRFVFLGGGLVLVGTLVGCCRKAEQDAQPQHGPSRDQCVFH
jgi:hypothetical protein